MFDEAQYFKSYTIKLIRFMGSLNVKHGTSWFYQVTTKNREIEG